MFTTGFNILITLQVEFVPLPPALEHKQLHLSSVFQLDRKAVRTKAVEILHLPKTGEDVKPHTKCRVAGWGSTKKDSCKVSNILKEVNITVIDRKICNNAEHYNFKPVISNSMICAGGKTGEDDSCEVSK